MLTKVRVTLQLCTPGLFQQLLTTPLATYAILLNSVLEITLRGGGGGGGGGVHPDFLVKLDFETAVDQQTKAHYRTFEGVPDSRCPPVPRDSHALVWSVFG